jgi:hypothetical protein
MRWETHPGHDRHQEEEKRLPVAFHVGLGQLHPYSENAYCQNDTREFEGDRIERFFVVVCPGSRVEDISAIRAWIAMSVSCTTPNRI